jgi:hypothetical protein
VVQTYQQLIKKVPNGNEGQSGFESLYRLLRLYVQVLERRLPLKELSRQEKKLNLPEKVLQKQKKIAETPEKLSSHG